jgi:hypothetical protein
MNIIALITGALGIGGKFLEGRQKLKELKQTQEFKIIEANTSAIVDRIKNNTSSDNEIDIITARNKKYTYKDEFVTYLFLMPVVVATAVPFIIAYQNDSWVNLNQYTIESYGGLNQLPEWFRYAIGAVIIDVLGFRSFARKIMEKIIEKKKII